MKKLVLTLVLGVFAFGASDLNAKNAEFQTDCVQVAMDVFDSWSNNGFTDRYASGKADAAYDSCIAHNGPHYTAPVITNN